MKFRYLLFPVMLTFASFGAAAEQISPGAWLQTSSTAGDCPNCEVEITRVTPHILQLTSNNGWTGYAFYSEQDDKYRGAFQWGAGKGGAFENVLFLVQMVYEGETLSLSARSNPLSFSSTYRKR